MSDNKPDNESEPSSPLWEDIYLEEDGDDLFDTNEDGCLRGIRRDQGLSGPFDTPKQYIPCSSIARYNSALKNLIPVRRKKPKENSALGIDEAGLISFVTLNWLTKYFTLAYHKGLLKVDDIPNPSPYDTCEYNVQRLETIWNDEVARKGTQSASLGYATWKFIRTRVFFSVFLLILNALATFVIVAIFTRKLLEYAESKDASVWEGFQWAILLTLGELFRTILFSYAWVTNYRTAGRLRSACLSMLYRKLLRVYCLENKTVGELVNMFANDGQRLFDLLLFAPMIAAGPVSLILGATYVYWILGPWAMLGLLVMLIFYPLQYGLSRLSGYLKRKALIYGDLRLNSFSEMLSNMKFVKFYAWGDVFKKQISDVRKKELNLLKNIAYTQSFSLSLSATAPVLSAILTFLVHIAVIGHLTASQAFSIITIYFKSLRNILHFTREGLRSVVEFNLAIQRFKAFPVITFLSTQLRLSLTYTQYALSNIRDLAIVCERFKHACGACLQP